MHYRLLFTIATAACLTGLYAVYAVIARPLVVVSKLPENSTEPSNRPVAHRPAENVRVAETYLAELRWAASSQYTLRSGQAFIYTNEWSHQGTSPWIEFAPFAMVWVQKDSQGREQAISLVSDSAQLKFATEFDIINPDPGRVVSAVLDGTVQIKGPDGLAVVGKQFIFDESAPSLVSTNPVQFEYGTHSGEGRSLHMALIPAEGPPGKDRPHVYGIRTVRLGSGIHPTLPKFMYAKLNLRIPQQAETKQVHIRCSSDLELDIPSQTIVFSKDVWARSPVNKTQIDELNCDELKLEFEPAGARLAAGIGPENDPKQPSAGAPGADFQRFSSDLVFKRLTASGAVVKVKSQRYQLDGQMQKLVFDAAEHRLQMTDATNTDPANTNKAKGVIISQKQSRLIVPEIEMLLRDDNTLPPQVVFCKGKGQLEMTNEDSTEVEFIATWAGFLRKSTDPENGLDLILLQHQATFHHRSQKTILGADLIRLWLDPTPLGTTGTSSEASNTRPADPKPRRLVAERKVALVSPLLEISKTNELDVRFEDDKIPRSLGLESRAVLQRASLQEQSPPRPQLPGKTVPKSTAATRDSSPSRTTAVTKVSHVERGSLGEAIDIRDSTNDAGRPGVARLADKKAEPLEVSADRIRVRMQTIDGQSQPEPVEVETQGRVKISRRGSPGEAPMTATGDRLHLQRHGLDREIVHLFGNPAHLRDRGLHVEGHEVNLDREANRIWVKGNGLLQLPVPPGTSIASLGETSDPDLDVWWQESMEFDGKTARFIGKVLAEHGLSKMWCEQMDVDLVSAVSFTGDEPAHDDRPGLKSIRCRENVSFQSSQYKDRTMVHFLRGHVAEFSHDHERGVSNAQGPGRMLIWQRSEKSEAGPQSQKMQANRPLSAVNPEWDFTRIDFKGRMTGSLVMYAKSGSINRQTSNFDNSVTIVHGPVDLPNEIDADHLPAEAASMRCEKLEFQHYAKGPNNSVAYQKMLGTGNAQIEGRGFYANADEISFDGSKKLYILRAWGTQNATISHDSDKGPREEASGRRIEFNRVLKKIKVDLVSGATGP